MFDDRFVLRYRNKSTFAEKDIDEVLISAKNNQIQISSTKDRIHTASLFALDGKQLFQTQQLKTKTHLIEATQWKSKVVIVKVILETGQKISRKLVF